MSGILTPLISRLRLRQRRFRQRVLRRTSSSTYASTGMDLADELTPLRLPSLSGPEAEWLLPEVTSESMALDNVEEEASLLEALRWVSRRDHDRISEIDGQGRPHELFSQRRGSEDEPVQSGEAMAGKMMGKFIRSI